MRPTSSSAVASGVPSGSSACAGVVAGEREEDLVERGLGDADGDDLDAGLAQRRSGRRRPGRRRSSATLIRPDSGVSTGSCAEHAGARRRAASSWSASVGEPQLQRRVADRGLELVRRALGDLAAAVDDRDPVGELVGLVEVLRGEQDGAAVGDERRGSCPTSGRGCAGRGRWSARRGRSAAAG